ncbi:hypothetical protein NXT08_10515 [Rhodococcus pyridinivorans]|uniref:hypothetical protein n=1 Tax=Rhodococcus pyridinivorans TaxID=103816 RepID=UPI002164D9B6|nr:hypothetical protein [Rhodococcus pyridinivorans]UVT26970.1 hypothetical protein NXT08_10515 [Rhodococcus pyridinivorans]
MPNRIGTTLAATSVVIALAGCGQRQPSTVPGFEGVGFKGGSLPGILTDAVTFRRDDDTISTTVMLASGMSDSDYAEALESFAHQEMLAAAANDPDFLERIRCAM